MVSAVAAFRAVASTLGVCAPTGWAAVCLGISDSPASKCNLELCCKSSLRSFTIFYEIEVN